MSTFTIDPDNNIKALVELPANADRSATFSTENELAKLAAEWPISRLIDAWSWSAHCAFPTLPDVHHRAAVRGEAG
jgi:hypothetical protein